MGELPIPVWICSGVYMLTFIIFFMGTLFSSLEVGGAMDVV
jgi:hypothetical protein